VTEAVSKQSPTIYTGSPNFSAASENGNDENELEIKGCSSLQQRAKRHQDR
jgi:hypothetical protein